MNETLKMMRLAVDKNLSGLNNEQLVELYQKTGYDAIIAQIFVENYPLFWKQYSKSTGFMEEDEAASLSLMVINRCLDSYDASKKVKFITLLTNALVNAYGSELKKKNRLKRNDDNDVSLNNFLNDDEEYQDLFGVEENGYKRVEVNMVIESSTLSDRVKQICKLHISGYPNNVIADMFKISKPTVCQAIKKLRKINVG